MIKRLRAGLTASANDSTSRSASTEGIVSLGDQRERAKIIMDKSERNPEILLKEQADTAPFWRPTRSDRSTV